MSITSTTTSITSTATLDSSSIPPIPPYSVLSNMNAPVLSYYNSSTPIQPTNSFYLIGWIMFIVVVLVVLTSGLIWLIGIRKQRNTVMNNTIKGSSGV